MTAFTKKVDNRYIDPGMCSDLWQYQFPREIISKKWHVVLTIWWELVSADGFLTPMKMSSTLLKELTDFSWKSCFTKFWVNLQYKKIYVYIFDKNIQSVSRCSISLSCYTDMDKI